MKTMLMLNYKFIDPVIYKYEDDVYIKENNKLYILKNTNIDQYLINLTNNDNSFYKALKNTNNEYVTKYKENNYILININNKYKIDINDILTDNLINNDQKIEWIEKWENKVDNLEKELEKYNVKEIDETKDYYFGLAENAIMFLIYNKNKLNTLGKSVCRKRINEKEYRLPTNAILDHKERDIAEYIKHLFFNKNVDKKNIIKIINNIDFKDFNVELIFARLLFPTYYFDLIDSYINKNNDIKKEISKILDKSEEYEELLCLVHNKYLYKHNIIEWIKKVD